MKRPKTNRPHRPGKSRPADSRAKPAVDTNDARPSESSGGTAAKFLSYRAVLAAVGITTFWLCFSCLWHERAAQPLGLPLDFFKGWATEGERAGAALTMIGILVCWPFAIVTTYLLWRIAHKAAAAGMPRWKRLPSPFETASDVTSADEKLIGIFFLILFWAVPAAHVVRFTDLFFFDAAPQPMFRWNWQAWLFGEDSSGTDMLYAGLTYFGWIPFLVLLELGAFATFSVMMWRACLSGEQQPRPRIEL